MVKGSEKNTFSLKPSKKLNSVTEKGKNTPVKSVFRAADILRCVSNNVHAIKDIAEHSGLSMATVHRILQTLGKSGLAFQDPVDHKYYLGPLFNQLSLDQISAHKYLIVQSNEEMNRLWELFGELTVLHVDVGIQIITLIEKQSRFNYSIKELFVPMFYGSVSKVLMAQRSDEEIEQILNSIAPKPLSKYCVTDKTKLKEQFKEARRQGYYVSQNEIDEGIMGISVPVKNYKCAAALSIVAPIIRLESVLTEVLKEMLISSNRISDRIAKGK